MNVAFFSDINECDDYTCPGALQVCENNPGSFTCVCEVGYYMNSVRECEGRLSCHHSRQDKLVKHSVRLRFCLAMFQTLFRINFVVLQSCSKIIKSGQYVMLNEYQYVTQSGKISHKLKKLKKSVKSLHDLEKITFKVEITQFVHFSKRMTKI